jgi:hypothetical protein
MNASICNHHVILASSTKPRLGIIYYWTNLNSQEDEHRLAIEAVDRTLRGIRAVDCPFAGITVILSGDFQQISLDTTIQRSFLWPAFQIFPLTNRMRLEPADNWHMASMQTRPSIQVDSYSRTATDPDDLGQPLPSFSAAAVQTIARNTTRNPA